MPYTPYNALCLVMQRIEDSVTSLGYNPCPRQIEKWAMVILEGMSGPSRTYHGEDHILELSKDMDPISTISALFHDIVYYQVDGGLTPLVKSFIFPYFSNVNGILHVKELSIKDPVYEISIGIFGYSPGQQLLPSSGQNEFLSTLLALKVMSEILSSRDLLMVALCIEATIPFRAHTKILEILRARTEEISKKMSLNLSSESIEEGIKRAAKLANKDVGSFSSDHVAEFLEQTWQLLPETNVRLTSSNVYSIREYRSALLKMETFLSNLRPEVIYFEYKGVAEKKYFHSLVKKAKFNLEVGINYLRIKLYTVSILEALSEITGGGVPLIFFMGDLKHQTQGNQLKIRSFLEKMPQIEKTEVVKDSLMYQLLEIGRAKDSSYDTKASPLSAYLYKILGEKEILKKYVESKKMFHGQLSHEKFLQQQNQDMIATIAKACAELAYTRKKKLQSIEKILRNNKIKK